MTDDDFKRRLAYLESKILEATQAFFEKQKQSDERISELEGIVRQQAGLSESAHKGQVSLQKTTELIRQQLAKLQNDLATQQSLTERSRSETKADLQGCMMQLRHFEDQIRATSDKQGERAALVESKFEHRLENASSKNEKITRELQSSLADLVQDYEGFRAKVKDFLREFKKQLEHKISGSMGVLHETLSRLQTVLGAEIHARESCTESLENDLERNMKSIKKELEQRGVEIRKMWENIHRQMQCMIQEVVAKQDHVPLDMMSRLRFEEFERQHVIDLRSVIHMIRGVEANQGSVADFDTAHLTERPTTCQTENSLMTESIFEPVPDIGLPMGDRFSVSSYQKPELSNRAATTTQDNLNEIESTSKLVDAEESNNSARSIQRSDLSDKNASEIYSEESHQLSDPGKANHESISDQEPETEQIQDDADPKLEAPSEVRMWGGNVDVKTENVSQSAAVSEAASDSYEIADTPEKGSQADVATNSEQEETSDKLNIRDTDIDNQLQSNSELEPAPQSVTSARNSLPEVQHISDSAQDAESQSSYGEEFSAGRSDSPEEILPEKSDPAIGEVKIESLMDEDVERRSPDQDKVELISDDNNLDGIPKPVEPKIPPDIQERNSEDDALAAELAEQFDNWRDQETDTCTTNNESDEEPHEEELSDSRRSKTEKLQVITKLEEPVEEALKEEAEEEPSQNDDLSDYSLSLSNLSDSEA